MAQKKLVKVQFGNVKVLNRLLSETDKEYKKLNSEVEGAFKLLRVQVKNGDALIDKMLEATKQYGELKSDFEKVGLDFNDYAEAKEYKTMASRVVGVKNLIAEIKRVVS